MPWNGYGLEACGEAADRADKCQDELLEMKGVETWLLQRWLVFGIEGRSGKKVSRLSAIVLGKTHGCWLQRHRPVFLKRGGTWKG